MGDRKLTKTMFLGKERFFYQGLLGAWMKPRTMGSFCIYIAPTTHFKIRFGDSDWEKRTIATVAPYVSHQIVSECGNITSLGVEPELVDTSCLDRVAERVNSIETRSDSFFVQLMASRNLLSCVEHSSYMTTEDFDHLVFGELLQSKEIDPRIAKVLGMFDDDLAEVRLAAQDCARAVDLSTSRFLHLFKDATGLSYRSFRMWKRARHFLAYANLDNSLTTVALDLGYPDSSHFSHSIRKTFGLKPRSIRDGSRDLQVNVANDYSSACEVQMA